jgi:hypothetical protein
MTNQYLEKVAAMSYTSKRRTGVGVASVGGALALNGITNEYRGYKTEKRINRFVDSALPKVERARKNSYADESNVAMKRLKNSISDKYYKAKHRSAKTADRLFSKGGRSLRVGGALMSAGAALYATGKHHEAEKQ